MQTKGATGELPGGDELAAEALSLAPGVNTVSGAIKSEAVAKALTAVLGKVNSDGKACPSNACKIQKFSILPRDFSVETGEFTATLKLRRSEVMKFQHDLIDKIYASKDAYVPSL